MRDLPAFDSEKSCPKCCGTDITTLYCSGCTTQCYCHNGYHIGYEHLRRTCTRCGYGWSEVCCDIVDEGDV